ncbi:hypothetical protein [Alcanivorax sp.]|uniref:hypothetical protein n=1 Tax=Alcanivorax sp. TaxID=1872427 RepID=UPI0025C47356|nr:hypothetical protein [Alcanivorax sp.]
MSEVTIEYINLFRDAALKRFNLTEKDWIKAVKLFDIYKQAMNSIYQNKWKNRFKGASDDIELSSAYLPYIESLLGRSEEELIQVIQSMKNDQEFSVFPPNPNQLFFLFGSIKEEQNDAMYQPFEPLKSRRDND